MLSILKQKITAIPRQQNSKRIGFLNMIGVGSTLSDSRDRIDVQVTEVNSSAAEVISTVNLTTFCEFINIRLATTDAHVIYFC